MSSSSSTSSTSQRPGGLSTQLSANSTGGGGGSGTGVSAKPKSHIFNKMKSVFNKANGPYEQTDIKSSPSHGARRHTKSDLYSVVIPGEGVVQVCLLVSLVIYPSVVITPVVL